MNEFNVLLAAATNGTPSGSLFDALFARYIAPQDSWREFESPLPITILAAGEDLIDYRIYGNTVGGESVGERTENLYNKDDPDIVYSAYMDTYGIIRTGTYGDAVKVSGYIPINGGRTYIGTNLMNSGSGNFYSYYDANKQRMEGGVVSNNTVFDSPINAAYIRTTLIHRNIEDLSVVTEGSTAPTSYIPYGYKLPMEVRSGNLFDKSFEQGFYRLDDGGKGSGLRYVRSNDKIPVSSDETYTVTYTCPKEGVPLSGVGRDSYILFWEADSSYIGYQQIMEKGNQTFTTPSNAAYVGFNIGAGSSGDGTLTPSDVSNFMLNTGSTALPYQPYSRTDIPIYIGDTPLAEDEYVDFGEQKVYRMEGGTLTPTDPPAPIPALPTIEGETIIDYNPSTTPAVDPEKMYIKYKPQ